MYARDSAYTDSAYMVDRDEGKDDSFLGGAMITLVWALTLTFSLFAVIGAVALFLI
jgi:hypothetical protein